MQSGIHRLQHQYLEIAVPDGSAAQYLGAEAGETVTVRTNNAADSSNPSES